MKTQIKVGLYGLSMLCFGLVSNHANAQRLRDQPPVPNFIKFDGHKTGDQPTYTERLKNLIFPGFGFFSEQQTPSNSNQNTNQQSFRGVGLQNHANENRTKLNIKK